MSEQRNARGFTLVEVTIILTALAILAAVLLPNLGGFNRMARKIRVKEDLGVLCSALKMMLDDIGASAFFSAGGHVVGASGAFYGAEGYAYGEAGGARRTWTTEYADEEPVVPECDTCQPRDPEPLASITTVTTEWEPGARAGGYGYSYGAGTSTAFARSNAPFGHAGVFFPVGLLVGDGKIPDSAIGLTNWQLEFGTHFIETTVGSFPQSIRFVVDGFGNQLIHQDPTLGVHATLVSSSVTGSRVVGSGGILHHSTPAPPLFRWRGPYIADRIVPDPWGNRYMANVFALHKPLVNRPNAPRFRHFGATFSTATVCYSAGADGTIETAFHQPFGWFTGGDDVTAVLAGAGGLY